MDEDTHGQQDDNVNSDSQIDLGEETDQLIPLTAPSKSTKKPTGRKRSRRQIQEDEEDNLLKRAVSAFDKM